MGKCIPVAGSVAEALPFVTTLRVCEGLGLKDLDVCVESRETHQLEDGALALSVARFVPRKVSIDGPREVSIRSTEDSLVSLHELG